MKRFFDSGWRVLFLVVLCAVGAVLALSWGFDAGIDDESESESRELIDKAVPEGLLHTGLGVYRGVGLSDSAAEVRRAMGEPEEVDGDAYTPTVVGFHDPWIGPYSATCGRSKMAYRDAMFILGDGRVCAIIVAGGGWSTSDGVSAGDSIEGFEAENPDADCFDVSLTEYNLEEQRDCRLKLDNGLLLWVGGEPLNGVAITGGDLRR